MTETKSHRILLPMNRTGRRFLRTVNKLRLFFYDDHIKCIPCVENPFQLLLNTKKLKQNRIKIIKILYSKNLYEPMTYRYAIQFNGSKDKRMKLLADYLRTEIITNPKSKGKLHSQYAVLLPKSISNFMQSKQVNRYIHSKFQSMEQQIKLCFPDDDSLYKVKSLED
jgi:hypothetical protein